MNLRKNEECSIKVKLKKAKFNVIEKTAIQAIFAKDKDISVRIINQIIYELIKI